MAHNIEPMDIGELITRQHPQNPKGHDIPKLVESLVRFGFAAPVLLCERTGLIAAGHGRTQAVMGMRQQGMDRPEFIAGEDDEPWLVPVVRGWASADDDELLAYVIADNRQNELGGWEDRLLVDILPYLREQPRGLEGLGYDSETVDAIIARMAPPVPPSAFPEVDPGTMSTDYRCPRCAYEWSGSPAPGGIPETDEEVAARAAS